MTSAMDRSSSSCGSLSAEAKEGGVPTFGRHRANRHHHRHHQNHHHHHHHHQQQQQQQHTRSSLSQPCLPVSNVGPTRILPFLFLGSQMDSLCKQTMAKNGITYVLNVSTSSPKPPFISDNHFLRVPVNDGYCDRLEPFFKTAFNFLDKVREASGCVLVHCLAGISRSPTLAIAYMMRSFNMTTDEAYRYVKEKRPTIAPNFNFLGQLLDYEKELQHERKSTTEMTKMSGTTSGIGAENSLCCTLGDNNYRNKLQDNDSSTNRSPITAADNLLNVKKQRMGELNFEVIAPDCHSTSSSSTSSSLPSSSSSVATAVLASPTTALSKLHFGGQLSPLRENPSSSSGSSGSPFMARAVSDGAALSTEERQQQQPSAADATVAADEQPVVIRLGAKHYQRGSGGTLKRPLSEPVAARSLQLTLDWAREGQEDSVVASARRPSARPRSITLGVLSSPAQPEAATPLFSLLPVCPPQKLHSIDKPTVPKVLLTAAEEPDCTAGKGESLSSSVISSVIFDGSSVDVSGEHSAQKADNENKFDGKRAFTFREKIDETGYCSAGLCNPMEQLTKCSGQASSDGACFVTTVDSKDPSAAPPDVSGESTVNTATTLTSRLCRSLDNIADADESVPAAAAASAAAVAVDKSRPLRLVSCNTFDFPETYRKCSVVDGRHQASLMMPVESAFSVCRSEVTGPSMGDFTGRGSQMVVAASAFDGNAAAVISRHRSRSGSSKSLLDSPELIEVS